MTTRQKIVLVFAVVFLVGIIVAGFVFQNRARQEQEKIIAEKAIQEATAEKMSELAIPPAYTPEVPKDAKPTEAKNEIPIVTESGEKKGRQGTFAITVTEKGYEPEALTVKQGDLVEIELTAKGGDFDMFSSSKGFLVSAKDGKTEKISFYVNTSGTFLFECRDACPASGKIYGQLIVMP